MTLKPRPLSSTCVDMSTLSQQRTRRYTCQLTVVALKPGGGGTRQAKQHQGTDRGGLIRPPQNRVEGSNTPFTRTLASHHPTRSIPSPLPPAQHPTTDKHDEARNAAARNHTHTRHNLVKNSPGQSDCRLAEDRVPLSLLSTHLPSQPATLTGHSPAPTPPESSRDDGTEETRRPKTSGKTSAVSFDLI